jgi:transcription initiation factor IIE alpha subunit
MPSIPIQAAARQKTPFDEVIEKNLATLSDEEIRELQSDQNGEITEALQLLRKNDSIHCKQSRLRRWNHKIAKYTAWLPAIQT